MLGDQALFCQFVCPSTSQLNSLNPKVLRILRFGKVKLTRNAKYQMAIEGEVQQFAKESSFSPFLVSLQKHSPLLDVVGA